MPDNYAVHDIVQRDDTQLSTTGQLILKRVVTFYVGEHGPFRLEYDRTEATGDKIQHDIETQVVQLRNVGAYFTGSQLG